MDIMDSSVAALQLGASKPEERKQTRPFYILSDQQQRQLMLALMDGSRCQSSDSITVDYVIQRWRSLVGRGFGLSCRSFDEPNTIQLSVTGMDRLVSVSLDEIRSRFSEYDPLSVSPTAASVV